MSISVFYEATPNPQSMKFLCTSAISTETADFKNSQEASRSPLASKLFGFPWAESIFVGPNFVTVTKQDWVDWDIIADPLSQLIEEHLASDQPVILPEVSASQNSTQQNRPGDIHADDSDIVKEIKTILNDEVRPAVAMDGGDIEFSHFENGKVYLHMKGACSGCPSSALTLKHGIEVRIRRLIPQVEEVIAL